MRVIAGNLKGRVFASPHSRRTHPMSDKIRGALFNALGELSGLTVLDAFAGSGALSFEAVSRGAAHVTAIEIDKSAYRTIAENIEALDLRDTVTVLRKNVSGWARSNRQTLFDVVLADPPYDDIRPDVLQRVAYLIKPGGLFVLSWPGNEPVRPFEGLQELSVKKHGDGQLVFYRHS